MINVDDIPATPANLARLRRIRELQEQQRRAAIVAANAKLEDVEYVFKDPVAA